MSTVELLLQELEQEAQTTRRVLERVPGDRLAWKPHDRSMSLGQLALHVASVPGAIAEISQISPFQVPKFEQPGATSVAELIRRSTRASRKRGRFFERWATPTSRKPGV